MTDERESEAGGLDLGELAMTAGVVLLVLAALLAVPQVRAGLSALLTPKAPA